MILNHRVTNIFLLVLVCVGSAIGSSRDDSVEEILTIPLKSDVYGLTERCISKARYRAIDVIDESIVMLSHSNDDSFVWLSILLERCRGLQPGQIIRLRKITPTICAGDSFAGLQRSGSEDPRDMMQVSKNCGFGMMHRIDKKNLPDLLQAIKSARTTRTVTETYNAF